MMKNASAFRFWAPFLVLGASSLLPVTPTAALGQAPQSAVQSSLDKARQLEVRGRMDLAAQAWQQVLLADSNNTEALAGLARAAKSAGNTALANVYLERLRTINPNDPAIARVETMSTQKDNVAQLQQAGKLAQQGQYEQAMAIYRRLYGDAPPPGDIGLGYYETEAATEEGRSHAIAGLRSLAQKSPGDTRYQIALGRILTYNPKTREEGRRLLSQFPQNQEAAAALRQSLLWDAQNPATAAEIRAYLQNHPDTQLTQILRDEPKAAARTAPLTAEQRAAAAAFASRSAADRAAYRELNAKHIAKAEELFKAILEKTPDDSNALAGMGYIRMQQANFAGALNFLIQARQDGSHDPGLNTAIATSTFWNTMAQGASALEDNDLVAAEKGYRAALTLRPNSPEALEALGGTLLRAQQPEAAAPLFIRFIKVNPVASHAWRGLFLAQSQAGNNPAALDTVRQFPAPVRNELAKDPLFLRQLASSYTATGRDGDAQRVLQSALNLPFPTDARGLETETQLQYASLLAQANRQDQAAGLFRLVLAKDQNNVGAWQGLVRAEHAQGHEAEAIQTLESTPPAVYAKAMRDAGFESTVASIYQQQKRLDVAQDILEKAIAQQVAAGQKPAVITQIQLAGIYLERNDPQQAYPIYQQVLTANPDRVDAWKGLLSALHDTGRDREALAQVQQIPQAPRAQLEGDVEYLQTVGNIYNGLGQPQEAQVFLRRVEQHYADQHAAPPADIAIQNGWLLYNGGSDQGLYRQLMDLGSRSDLTDAQRRTVQTIWANWAVRRANQAAAAGNNSKALAILNATAHAFPDNAGVIKALAGGYARAGMPKEAVLIWKAQDLSTASASDYRAAVGAALAANDPKDAETWLRFALNEFPKDGDLLILAARFEQARGDTSRAADYYRASLNALPPADPGAELATELSRPMPSVGAPGRRAGQDLASLLRPGANDQPLTQQQQGAQPESGQPYLPGTGSFGAAPVALSPSAMQPANDAPVVPQFMSSPSGGRRAPAAAQDQPKTRLRDYVPQAALDAPLPPDATALPASVFEAANEDDQLRVTDAVYRGGPVELASASTSAREAAQVVRTAARQVTPRSQPLTAQPVSYTESQNGQPGSQQPGLGQTSSGQPAPNQTQTAQPQTQTQAGQTGSEVYGPYVPYKPPPSPAPAPLPGSVQLGAAQPAYTPPKAKVTDVLPKARYVPNAKTHPGTSNAQINAANAAAERRRQSVPADPLSGQSKPPAEVYSTAPTENVQYRQQNGQVAQPGSTLPAAQNSGSVQPPAATDGYGQQYPQPRSATSGPRHVRTPHRATESVRTAPPPAAPPPTTYPSLSYPGIGEPLSGQPYPSAGAGYQLGPAPTDSDLISKRLPPLGGRYGSDPLLPQVPLSARQEAERDLESLESSYSSWLGGTASARYRSGTAGIDRLTDLEAGVEASATLGDAVRLTVVPRAVFLTNGSLNVAQYAGVKSGVPIVGTFLANAALAPAQQPQSGVGGELQLSTRSFGAAIGYTPYQFLVQNFTGRVLYKPTTHFTLYADRSAVTETELSYAGLRDPQTVTPVNAGNIWGGVVATGGGLRFDLGDERAGFYITADGADLSGFHVLENYKFEGSAGVYFLAHTFPGYGRLNVGASLFGMHYQYNELGLTYGLGGYFSPSAFFLASVPVTFTGRYRENFHYNIAGSVGVQTFQEESQIYFPLDRALQANAALCTAANLICTSPVNSNTGGNYSINSEGAYRIAEHWYAGGFLSANNTNNYNTVTGGFFVRYLFRPQFGSSEYPTGLFPVDGFRPLRVP